MFQIEYLKEFLIPFLTKKANNKGSLTIYENQSKTETSIIISSILKYEIYIQDSEKYIQQKYTGRLIL